MHGYSAVDFDITVFAGSMKIKTGSAHTYTKQFTHTHKYRNEFGTFF